MLLEDLDPYRHLTERWPGDTLTLRLVEENQSVRLIDTGPGDTPAFIEALERADYVIVPVRPEPNICAGTRAVSRIVVRRVQGLCAVLDAGPLSALSPGAVGNRRAFATRLAEYLSPIAKE